MVGISWVQKKYRVGDVDYIDFEAQYGKINSGPITTPTVFVLRLSQDEHAGMKPTLDHAGSIHLPCTLISSMSF